MDTEVKSFSYGLGGVSFYEELNTKGEPEYYVAGYITTEDLDLTNDIVTQECMDDMAAQLELIPLKLDYEHETVMEQNMNKNPVGRKIEFRRDNKGIWVKFMLNPFREGFDKIWGSIKSGMLDAFSITFKPIKKSYSYLKDKLVRKLEKIELINVALTGNPVNTHARMTEVVGKSLDYMESMEKKNITPEGQGSKEVPEGNIHRDDVKADSHDQINCKEVTKMAENNVNGGLNTATAPAVKEEPKKEEAKAEEMEEPKKEEKKAETTESTSEKEEENEEEEAETKSLQAQIKSMGEKIAEQEKTITELKAIIEKPQMKALSTQPTQTQRFSGPLSLLK